MQRAVWLARYRGHVRRPTHVRGHVRRHAPSSSTCAHCFGHAPLSPASCRRASSNHPESTPSPSCSPALLAESRTCRPPLMPCSRPAGPAALSAVAGRHGQGLLQHDAGPPPLGAGPSWPGPARPGPRAHPRLPGCRPASARTACLGPRSAEACPSLWGAP